MIPTNVTLAILRPRRRRLLTATIVAALTLVPATPEARATTYFRSSTSAQTGTGATSITLNAPAGMAPGDLLVASISAEGTNGMAAPAGWSAANLWEGPYTAGDAGVYFHVAGAAEPASYTWGLGSSRRASGQMVDYVGVETGAPIEASAVIGGTTGTNDEAPSVNTSVANSTVVNDFAALDGAGAFTFTAPVGTTLRASSFTTGGGPQMGIETVDFNQATPGATGVRRFTTSASIPWGALTYALRPSAGALVFDVAPSTPSLATVALSGKSQTVSGQMNSFAVDDTAGEAGWNVTVSGNAAAGRSAVFKQYCSNGASACGATPADSYVTGGFVLPADSLRLNTTGASWNPTGGAGAAPAFQCASGCAMDSATPVKIVSAAAKAGLGPWASSGLSAASLSLAVPASLHTLPEHEVYRVDLLWTLSSGP